MVNATRDYISVVVLFLINLLNFIDRYTVAGVLTQVQEYYDIDDSMAGLIQTVFIVFFMVFSPLCGYLGDRVNRKIIILIGILVWIGAVLVSTFAPANHFWMFLLFRGVVGIGEASYSNIAPSLISDMFSGPARARMFTLFYFAVPVGSGLGFIIGSNVASLTGQWQWGVRVTACAGVVVFILHLLFVYEPERGAAEKADGAHAVLDKSTNYWEDLKSLVKIPTYVACTWAYTALVFVSGSLAWWEPTIVENAIAWQENITDTGLLPDSERDKVGLLYGGITTVAGIIGVAMGNFLAVWLKEGKFIFKPFKTDRAEPIICAVGVILATPLLLLAFIFGHKSILLLWILLFFIITFLCFNWGLNVDLLTTVIVPSRRSTAYSYFLLVSHLFGDAIAPYIIGVVSDSLRNGSTHPKDQYNALVKASYMCVGVLVVSAVLYLITAITLLRDQHNFDEQLSISHSKAASSESIEKIPVDVDTITTRI